MSTREHVEEVEPDEIDEEPEIETTVISVDVEAAPQRIESMIADGWALDDHIVAQPRVILIFSREKE
jgi:hypothetical protein